MVFAMQQLLLSWFLVGKLELPATQVGFIQAVIGVPGVFLMLLGGAAADRQDPRSMLLRAYLLGPIFPFALAAYTHQTGLDVPAVLIWGLGMSIVQAMSMPAQQALLSRIAGQGVQRAVTMATVVTFVVQVMGLGLAGMMDTIGVPVVLSFQGLALGLSALSLVWIAPVAVSPSSEESQLQRIIEGFEATRQNPVVLQTTIINFVSGIFNAGSFFTVFPFIVKRVYDGDEVTLAIVMAIFFAGAAISNLILFRFQPLRTPGRVFLVMQLSRVIVLALLYVKGDLWLLVLASLLWGVNMGVTSNLARSIVQECAPAEFRGRIMAVFSISLMGTAPIGALVLGVLVESVGTLNALWPAMLISVVLFAYGWYKRQVWAYQSASAVE